MNTNMALIDFCEEIHAKHVFISSTSFSSVSNDSNVVLSLFSQAKR
jgi:hypothetical protein